MANGKRVQFARGTREAEDAVTGREGELRVDLTRHEIRVHDGVKQGGYPMASRDYVESFLNGTGDNGSGGSLQFFASEAELKQVQPSSSVLAILREDGKEDSFVWQQGAAEAGDVASDISGYWKRLDGQAGFAVMLARAGLITLQIDGAEPVTNQATTVWLENGVIKLWNLADYINATPALWMALFASVGGYSTAEFTLPDRLAAMLTESTNLDTIILTGWYKSSSGATGNAVAGVNVIEHRQISAALAIQFCHPPGDATGGYYVRNRTDDDPLTWSSWVYVEGIIPPRLAAAQSTISDANSATDSGFYRLAAASSNAPDASVAGLITVRFDSNRISQMAISQSGVMAFRTREAGTWSGWSAISITSHTHDDRYYTEAEVTSLLAGKAALSHVHDDRYYTESEVNSLLAGKMSSSPGLYDIGSYVATVYPGNSFSIGLSVAAGTIGLPGTTWICCGQTQIHLSGYSGYLWRRTA